MPVRLLLFCTVLLAGCATRPQVYDVTDVTRPPDVVGDSLAREAARARVQVVRNPAVTPDRDPARSVDVLDTRLDLGFDFATQTVTGTASHRFTPLRDSLTSFYLHAVGMDIDSVLAVDSFTGATIGPLPFTYDSTRLDLHPDAPLRLGQEYALRIRYTAHPTRNVGPIQTLDGHGGLAGQGLYFIDPTGQDPFRPTQIWTQGQPEDNRRWFPGWDSPNDKAAFEIALTVPDSLDTFANGTLDAQTPLAGGLRRDRWRLALPIPSYLAAFAVGDFTSVRDVYTRRDGTTVPLEYVVEPGFADEAMAVFGETKRMMQVFEDEFGVAYPWPNYKQVVVRDFTAGGMENATVTLLTEEMQYDTASRDAADQMDLIAHELAHQWLGNLVTTNDWANLTLNEGFATFAELLYRERAHGFDAAQAASIAQRQGYLAEAARLQRPIVWSGYRDPGDLFDAHSYHKGGQVLWLLRDHLGPRDFARGVRAFLEQYRFRTAEVNDLRRVLEETTGQPLQRFFSQWFDQPGHPDLEVEQAFYPGTSTYTVQVSQMQVASADPRVPLYGLTFDVEFNYATHPRTRHRLHLTTADSTYRFQVPAKPTFVRFDEGDYLLGEVTVAQPLEERIAQARTDDEMAGRYRAVAGLNAQDLNPQIRQTLVQVLEAEAHPSVRALAADGLARYLRAPGVASALVSRLDADPSADVRVVLVERLAALDSVALVGPVLRRALQDERDVVMAAAIGAVARRMPTEAWTAYEALRARTTRAGVVEAALVAAIDTLRIKDGAPYLEAATAPGRPDDVRTGAVQALGRIAASHPDLKPGVRERALVLLADLRPPVRREAVAALLRIADETTLDAFRSRQAVEPDPAVKAALEEAIATLQRRPSTTTLGSR